MSSTTRLLHFGQDLVQSEIPLPSLLPVKHRQHARPTLHVTSPRTVPGLARVNVWDHVWTDRHGNPQLQIRREGVVHRLRMTGLCDMLIHPDTGTVDLEQCGQLDTATIEHLVIDQALPRLIAGRGACVLHAAAVERDDGCTLFLGESGWGKSTLSALLRSRGFTILSDDCVLLDVADGQPMAVPTYPSLRLLDDSRMHSGQSTCGAKDVAFYNAKQRLPVGATQARPVPVRAAYVLNDPLLPAANATIEVIPSPARVTIEFLRHSLRLDLVDRSHAARQLDQAVQTARTVPCAALRYPRDFSRTSELLDVLTAHMQTSEQRIGGFRQV